MALREVGIFSLTVIFCFGFYGCNAKIYTAQSCEGHTLKLSCWVDDMIQVLEADYGRWSSSVCKYFDDPNMNLTCHSRHADTIVKASCNGRRTCRMKANNENFLDPCPGQVKYAEAKYLCVTKDVPQARPQSYNHRISSSNDGGDIRLDKSVEAIANAIKNYQKPVTETAPTSRYTYNNNNNQKEKTINSQNKNNKQTITYGYNGDWKDSDNTKSGNWWNPDYNVNTSPEDNNKQMNNRPIGWNFNSSIF